MLLKAKFKYLFRFKKKISAHDLLKSPGFILLFFFSSQIDNTIRFVINHFHKNENLAMYILIMSPKLSGAVNYLPRFSYSPAKFISVKTSNNLF